MLFVFPAHSGIHIWTVWVTSSFPVFGGVRVSHLFSFFVFFCMVLLCIFTYWISCWDVRYGDQITTIFVLNRHSFVGEVTSYLRDLCLFFESNTYCVMKLVFLLCFASSCVHYVVSFSRLSIVECPFGIL